MVDVVGFCAFKGVAVTKDFDEDNEDKADGTEEDAWAMDGGCDVVEGRHDEIEGLVEIEESKEDCEV